MPITLKKPISIAALILVCGVGLTFAQPDKKPPQPPAPPPPPGKAPQPEAPKGAPDDQAAAMDAMMPGEVHAKLMKLVGDWEVASKLEVAPGQPPAESKGAVTIANSLDGRFLQETGAGEMMGMPTKHFKMWGFNKGSKKYEAVWAWTMSTGFLYMTGKSKDDGKTIDWDAWFDNEVGAREDFKCTTTFKDADHFTVKLFGGKMPDGTPGPTLIDEYSRKK